MKTRSFALLFPLGMLFLYPSLWAMGMNDTIQIPDLPLSVVEIPVRLHRVQLQDNINLQLGDTLYVEDSADGEGLEIRALKASTIEIQISGQEIFYKIPVDLWVRKKMRLAKLEATGALSLNLKTRYQIQENWSLETFTELVSYEWIQKPVLKTAVLDIPLKLVADLVLKNSQKKLTRTIDDQVKEALDLRKEIQSAWDMLHDPFLLSEEYATWMIMSPKSIYMTPFQTVMDTVESVIGLESELMMVLGDEPDPIPPSDLPPLEWRQVDRKGFSLMLQTDIPYAEAERLARESMVGMRFEQGKRRYVEIENIKLYREGDQLAIQTALSGTYNGNINLMGTPTYSEFRKKIELEDLDVELKTRNILHKTLGWLLKGVFKNEIRKSLDYYLNYYLDTTQKTLQEELKNKEIAPGVILNGELSRMSVDQIFLTPDAMRLWIGMKGDLEVDVEGLSLE